MKKINLQDPDEHYIIHKLFLRVKLVLQEVHPVSYPFVKIKKKINHKSHNNMLNIKNLYKIFIRFILNKNIIALEIHFPF